MSPVSTKGWSSSTFESAVENRSYKLILIQAAAFSLFMIMSNAWTEFFTTIVHACLPSQKEGGVWISLVRALASTVFCILLLFFMITVARTRWSVREKSVTCCGRTLLVRTPKKSPDKGNGVKPDGMER